MKFPEYKGLDLSEINKNIQEKWETDQAYEKSLEIRKGKPNFVFYEGPPSANGLPGIHHVISRTIKDIVCRYKTLKGFYVERKAGWDTHGLPVELSVEKSLNITKEDIGKKISIEKYNQTCREEVMKYTRQWEDLTQKMGYWINMDDPYITYDNRYIETLWHLLKRLFDKGLLYKGYTIQPYSPAAGTGLSAHELNQPGCYRDVKDTTCIAQFKAVKNEASKKIVENTNYNVYFLAWTTTPWTLPSNTALCVGPAIEYVQLETINPYSEKPVSLILAKDLVSKYFDPEMVNKELNSFTSGDKKIPYKIIANFKGSDLTGISYEQLIPWIKPEKEAFKVISGDFVTTEEGAGIVHIAPTFGADDDRVAKAWNIPPLILRDKDGAPVPMVDRRGKFYLIKDLDPKFVDAFVNKELYSNFSGRYVKNEYDETLGPKDKTIDVDIAVMLKHEEKAFRIEKHVHSYPHCWRTDKPVLYYPLDSWFIKTTGYKEKMQELNNTINWKPQSTGTGRFGNWLENLVDWNLSRSRYWGTPLPIWTSEDGTEQKCIGSVKELKQEIAKSVEKGLMKENPLDEFDPEDMSAENYAKFDLHRPYVDTIVLVSESGNKLTRETDLIDVWFDSGAMPYAQLHYPFENKDVFEKNFPADFIAEGVDQTRGWFFTLHALGTLLFDSVAFKNIISNGLVLDKNGNKMSKRLGNAIDPFMAIDKHGSDPLRWYMISNSQPWDNLKFDMEGVEEVKRKFFGTLYNTYSFFALYANVDGFNFSEDEIPLNERPELDQWILSLLNSLIKDVGQSYENYELTRAARLIQNFVNENLSNWYVRLSRKRFWGGKYDGDKISAYQSLYTCLEKVALLMSPIAPFYSEQLYTDLTGVSGKNKTDSVHYADFPDYDDSYIQKDLEQRMEIAQQVSSMVLGLRRKVKLKVRQPLNKILIPAINREFINQVKAVKDIILTEINVKDIEFLEDTSGILIKNIKPNFKALGPRFGKNMKAVATAIQKLTGEEIAALEQAGELIIEVNNEKASIKLDEVEILSEDIPGWLVANEGKYTVALDVTVTEKLKQEGIARELVNRIQNLRKESGFEVTDKINLTIKKHPEINEAVNNFDQYIGSQTLAQSVRLTDSTIAEGKTVTLDGFETIIQIEKIGK